MSQNNSTFFLVDNKTETESLEEDGTILFTCEEEEIDESLMCFDFSNGFNKKES